MILHANVCSALYRHAARGADVMIVDPPYSAKVHGKAISAGTGGAGVRKRDLGFGHLTTPLLLRIAQYAADVRRWSVVFSDRESTHIWRAAMALYGVEYVRDVPWVRWSQPQMSGDRPPTGAESILIFHAPRANQGGGKMHWNGPGSRVMYTAKSLRGADKYSCEKPLDLMLALVSDYSDPGETVFDPTCGVGTTCLAAALLGREAHGLEIDVHVAAWASERFNGTGGWLPEGAGLSERDEERAVRWLLETRAEASAVPAPRAANGSDVKTYERAQRRLADCKRLEDYGSAK